MSSGQKGIIFSTLGYCNSWVHLSSSSENSGVRMASFPTDQHTNYSTVHGGRHCQKKWKDSAAVCLLDLYSCSSTVNLHPTGPASWLISPTDLSNYPKASELKSLDIPLKYQSKLHPELPMAAANILHELYHLRRSFQSQPCACQFELKLQRCNSGGPRQENTWNLQESPFNW